MINPHQSRYSKRVKMLLISNAVDYANMWDEESLQYEATGAYSTLARYLDTHSPNGKILEFGCGTGLATRHLAENHEVLALENNANLLEKARINLAAHVDKVQLLQCDFFELTDSDMQTIQDFAPDVVIGWNIGTSGIGQLQRTSENLSLIEKPKAYRENVEDIIMEISGRLGSVELVNFVCRGVLPAGFDFQVAAKADLEDYNKYVFEINDSSKFKGKCSTVVQWDTSSSTMNYVNQRNTENPVGIFTSIIAERKKQ